MLMGVINDWVHGRDRQTDRQHIAMTVTQSGTRRRVTLCIDSIPMTRIKQT